MHAADRFLAEQTRQAKELTSKLESIEADVKKAKVAGSGFEKDAQAFDAKMGTLREAMNSARTNKEYTQFLTELNTLKAQKDEKEKLQLEQMEKAEAAGKQSAEVTAQLADRQKLVSKASEDRAEREKEIAGKLDELKKKRAALASEVPAEHLKLLAELQHRLGENAMAKLDEIDRRNHEWACSSCMRAVPVQAISMIVAGKLTRCSNCTCILFADEDQEIGAKKLKKKEPAEL